MRRAVLPSVNSPAFNCSARFKQAHCGFKEQTLPCAIIDHLLSITKIPGVGQTNARDSHPKPDKEKVSA